jgi:hypothetical protein
MADLQDEERLIYRAVLSRTVPQPAQVLDMREGVSPLLFSHSLLTDPHPLPRRPRQPTTPSCPYPSTSPAVEVRVRSAFAPASSTSYEMRSSTRRKLGACSFSPSSSFPRPYLSFSPPLSLRRNCPRCKKKRQAVKRLSLSKLPPILVIHLKRFSFDGPFSDKVRFPFLTLLLLAYSLSPLSSLSPLLKQIETQVQYPLSDLDLTQFIPPPLMDQRSGNAATPAPPSGGYVYDLFGVTNHYGNLSSGH